MKAIILAAGRGTRISRHINDKPKCTVPLREGYSLIEYSIDLLRNKGIDDISIVLGYRSTVIKDLLKDRGIAFYLNPFYDITNSIASLWFAKERIEGNDRVIIMNGDVFLSDEAINLILAETRDPVLFYDRSRREEADYKFFCDGDHIVKYGKELSIDETSGEYIGCASFGGAFVASFKQQLETLIMENKHSLWWEDVLYSMTKDRSVYAKDIAGAFWGEVDYVEDYERIMAYYRDTSPQKTK